MDKETKNIIQKIASIQVEALQNILDNLHNLNPSEEDMLIDLLGLYHEPAVLELYQDPTVSDYSLKQEIIETLENRIQGYKSIIEYPNLIKSIDERQLYICSHILFQMEDEWIIDNSQGVYGAWNVLFKESYKFHPELTLIWYYGKK